MKKEVDIYYSKGKATITLKKLVFYNILFFGPIGAAYVLSSFLAGFISRPLHITSSIATRIFMIFFTLIVFFFLVPYIRRKENILGVRYALIGFLIVGIVMNIPYMLQGEFVSLLGRFIYIAHYMLLTFIYCPEVLGIEADLRNWFRHYKQLFVIFVYVGIVLSYALGFAYIYYEISKVPGSYVVGQGLGNSYGTFLYYSIITFSTIGYGDITPVSPGARFVAGTEALFGMIINVVFIAILILYISNFQAMIKREELEIQQVRSELHKEEKEERKDMQKVIGKLKKKWRKTAKRKARK